MPHMSILVLNIEQNFSFFDVYFSRRNSGKKLLANSGSATPPSGAPWQCSLGSRWSTVIVLLRPAGSKCVCVCVCVFMCWWWCWWWWWCWLSDRWKYHFCSNIYLFRRVMVDPYIMSLAHCINVWAGPGAADREEEWQNYSLGQFFPEYRLKIYI